MKKNNDKTMGSILFAVLFVFIMEISQSLMTHYFVGFTMIHPDITNGISAFVGFLIAITITDRFFEDIFTKTK